MRLRLTFAAAGLGVALLAGQAPAAPAVVRGPPVPEDPFERLNRRFYGLQGGFNRVFLPIAKIYRALTPGPIGAAIHNMLLNLNEPVVIANDVLQARFRDAGRETLRLTANSTLGVGGMIDVAGRNGLPRKDNDFGITLGRWGAQAGPYLYLPLVGPSTVRDVVGVGADTALNPLTWLIFPGHITLAVSSGLVGGLDKAVHAEPQLRAIIADAADPYATLRSVYLQNREAAIRGESATPELPPLEDEPSAAPEGGEAPSATTPAPPASDQPPPASDQGAPPSQPPATSGEPAPRSPPTGAEAGPSPTRLVFADDPDAPIVTARTCDLVGAPSAHGA